MAVTNGIFSVDMETIPGGVKGKIVFNPSKKVCPSCKNIRLVQIVRVIRNDGTDFEWSEPEQNRNKVMTVADPAKGVQPGWFVDHKGEEQAEGKTASMFYRDYWPENSRDGGNTELGPAPASLFDIPLTLGLPVKSLSFETAAFCVDTGKFLGSVKWGFTVNGNGNTVMTASTTSDLPSANFTAAIKKFDNFYHN